MSQKFDRQILFGWVEKNSGRIRETIEKGVQKAQETVVRINQKIDENPKAKDFRKKVIEGSSAQFEKLRDVRIGHMRVGDLPEAAQRLVERQLYKMLNRVREVDPNFDWGNFVPDPKQFPIFDAFDTLGLPYGTPFEEVKKRYRTLMREWHPDKHAGNPEKERTATLKTQELTAAYEVICKHYGQ